MSKLNLRLIKGSGIPEPLSGPIDKRYEILCCKRCGNTGEKGPFEGEVVVKLRLKICNMKDNGGNKITGKYEPIEYSYDSTISDEVITRCLACGSIEIDRIPLGGGKNRYSTGSVKERDQS